MKAAFVYHHCHHHHHHDPTSRCRRYSLSLVLAAERYLHFPYAWYESVVPCGTTVGIATGYGLVGLQLGVWVPVRARFYPLHVVQTDFGVYPASYPVYTGNALFGGKAAGAWSWQLSPYQCLDEEYVDLYMHSPLRGLALYCFRSHSAVLHLLMLALGVLFN
jgi:hypothetical protein